MLLWVVLGLEKKTFSEEKTQNSKFRNPYTLLLPSLAHSISVLLPSLTPSISSFLPVFFLPFLFLSLKHRLKNTKKWCYCLRRKHRPKNFCFIPTTTKIKVRHYPLSAILVKYYGNFFSVLNFFF